MDTFSPCTLTVTTEYYHDSGNFQHQLTFVVLWSNENKRWYFYGDITNMSHMFLIVMITEKLNALKWKALSSLFPLATNTRDNFHNIFMVCACNVWCYWLFIFCGAKLFFFLYAYTNVINILIKMRRIVQQKPPKLCYCCRLLLTGNCHVWLIFTDMHWEFKSLPSLP